jgi:hypothetical protein
MSNATKSLTETATRSSYWARLVELGYAPQVVASGRLIAIMVEIDGESDIIGSGKTCAAALREAVETAETWFDRFQG